MWLARIGWLFFCRSKLLSVLEMLVLKMQLLLLKTLLMLRLVLHMGGRCPLHLLRLFVLQVLLRITKLLLLLLSVSRLLDSLLRIVVR